jgi:hypothetical protein
MRQRLLQVLASTIGSAALAGCSDIRDAFDESLCKDGEIRLLDDLRPAEPADYVALRSVSRTDNEVTVLDEVGECPTSANCQPVPEPDDYGFHGMWLYASEHLLVVRGEQVELLFTKEEVKTFLGTLDNAAEAALFTYASGYDLNCDGNNLDTQADGYLIYAERGQTCGGDITGYQVFVTADGTLDERDSEVVEEGDKNCIIGRLPAGLCDSIGAPTPPAGGKHTPPSARATDERALGQYLAKNAFLEAAAVAAFERLAAELGALGAPSALVERAQAAAREETRHAILMRGLARRWGAEAATPVVATRSLRSVFELALDNAVEGLTRERFGALLGLHQARYAKDASVRAVMRVIADDETGHAQFSVELHDWLWPQLSAEQQRLVALARLQAVARFRRAACDGNPQLIVDRLGVPEPRLALALFDELFRDVTTLAA